MSTHTFKLLFVLGRCICVIRAAVVSDWPLTVSPMSLPVTARHSSPICTGPTSCSTHTMSLCLRTCCSWAATAGSLLAVLYQWTAWCRPSTVCAWDGTPSLVRTCIRTGRSSTVPGVRRDHACFAVAAAAAAAAAAAVAAAATQQVYCVGIG
jgi:hypothetical protein